VELRARYGDEFDERLKRSFYAAGLPYAPPPAGVPRSLKALQVTELARDRGRHAAVHDRLMEAYWAEGADIGDEDVLRALAAEAGLATDEVERVLEGDDYVERIQVSTSQAQRLGANGIPAWLLNERMLVLGAQPREAFERALAQLETEDED
jgi:predicted DsbA family dithiol-disulfide isomerase